MSTQTKTKIHVPGMKIRISIPEICLGEVEYRTNAEGESFSVVEYFEQMQLPTLAELGHAFHGTKSGRPMTWHREEQERVTIWVPDNLADWLSPEYRESVLSNRGKGEWTATFLKDGRQIIERPEKVYYDKGRGIWIAEGGIVTGVELPDNGWPLEYSRATGMPIRTSQRREEAEEIFGRDTSYFYYSSNGLRALLRGFYNDDGGPFYVLRMPIESFGGNALFVPASRYPCVGARACRRSEQDAERLATPR